MTILPYGQIDELDQDVFDVTADSEPRWFGRHLDSLSMQEGSVVVVDLPARSTRATRHVLARANLVLCVSTADAAAYMCAPQMERLIRRFCPPRVDSLGHGYVLNQVDHAARLTSDVWSLFERDFRDRLVGTVHRDQSVPEALTHHMSVFDYMPESQAARDMHACVDRVAALLATCRAPLRVVSRAAMYG